LTVSDTRAEVGCAGILVADTFCGPLAALPPAGQLLSLDGMPSRPGGCAANVAIDLAKQGVRVDVAGRVGRDGGANLIVTAFAKHGIGCGRIAASDEHPTSTTVILLVRGEDRRYLHCFGANRAFTAADLPRDWLAGLKVFYLGGLLALPGLRADELLNALRFCRANGVVTVVDVVVPQGARDAMQTVLPLLPEIDYMLPNDDEAAELTGTTDPLGQVRTLLSCGAGNVIVTRGAAGAVAGSRAGDTFWRIGAYSDKAVIDPSGAGDAFASGIVTGILRGWEMDQTLRYAAALGASATRAVGTTDGVFTAAEAERFVAEHPLPVTSEPLSGFRVAAAAAGAVKSR
jgi:sugar/nucleoside kinase (ribokinase family)